MLRALGACASVAMLAMQLLAGCREYPAAGEDASRAVDSDGVPASGDASAADIGSPTPLEDAGGGDGAERWDAAALPPTLRSVEPASAGASVGAVVTLKGDGFSAPLRVWVGDTEASEVTLQPDGVRARFGPVALDALGSKDVRMDFSEGPSAMAANAFEYVFDEDPVVFVHGYGADASHFDSLIARFRSAGYPLSSLFAISYQDPQGSNLESAQELATFVQGVLAQTGAPKIDLVGHSMGAVSARLFLKLHGGAAVVRDFVSLAGANHGALMWSCAWAGEGACEMMTPYACEGEGNDVQFVLNGCLTDQGRSAEADETPSDIGEGGGIAYLSLWSRSDGTVFPEESPCLNMRRKADCSDPLNEEMVGLGHLQFLDDPGVFARVEEHLRERNRSK